MSCAEYLESVRSQEGDLNYDHQSKSALQMPGSSSDMHMVARAGLFYRITVHNEQKLGERIGFQVLDAKTKEVLYYNGYEDYSRVFEFAPMNTQKLVLRIKVMGESDSGSDLVGCVAVLIENKEAE